MVDNQDGNLYYEVTNWDITQAFRFRTPSPSIFADLRDVLSNLPLIPFKGGHLARDTMDSVAAIGQLDEVMARLTEILTDDYRANVAEVGDFCEFEVVVSELSLQPDAVHIVTRIWPKDESGGSILYGARVQHIAPGTFALWSDY